MKEGKARKSKEERKKGTIRKECTRIGKDAYIEGNGRKERAARGGKEEMKEGRKNGRKET